VAEDAGVRRSTLYRHFPDEDALFDACSAHWSAANPPPDFGAWAAVRDPDERLRRALGELYGWYAQVEGMLANLIRDVEVSAPVAKRFGAFPGLLAAAADVLLQGRRVRGRARERVRAALGHAVAFETWRSLVRGQGLAHDEAVALMAGLVGAAAGPRPR
jgi:AcrR family transcriptional regulator